MGLWLIFFWGCPSVHLSCPSLSLFYLFLCHTPHCPARCTIPLACPSPVVLSCLPASLPYHALCPVLYIASCPHALFSSPLMLCPALLCPPHALLCPDLPFLIPMPSSNFSTLSHVMSPPDPLIPCRPIHPHPPGPPVWTFFSSSLSFVFSPPFVSVKRSPDFTQLNYLLFFIIHMCSSVGRLI